VSKSSPYSSQDIPFQSPSPGFTPTCTVISFHITPCYRPLQLQHYNTKSNSREWHARNDSRHSGGMKFNGNVNTTG